MPQADIGGGRAYFSGQRQQFEAVVKRRNLIRRKMTDMLDNQMTRLSTREKNAGGALECWQKLPP